MMQYRDLINEQMQERAVLIRSALEAWGWNLARAADAIGLSSSCLWRMLCNAPYDSPLRSVWEDYRATSPKPGRR